MAGRPGPRPHVWKVPGEIPHQQHRAWSQSRAQAHFRKEPWDLSFEQFQQLWGDQWSQRGRGQDDLCLCRLDPQGSWHPDNLEIMVRKHHLARQIQFRMQ